LTHQSILNAYLAFIMVGITIMFCCQCVLDFASFFSQDIFEYFMNITGWPLHFIFQKKLIIFLCHNWWYLCLFINYRIHINYFRIILILVFNSFWVILEDFVCPYHMVVEVSILSLVFVDLRCSYFNLLLINSLKLLTFLPLILGKVFLIR